MTREEFEAMNYHDREALELLWSGLDACRCVGMDDERIATMLLAEPPEAEPEVRRCPKCGSTEHLLPVLMCLDGADEWVHYIGCGHRWKESK